MRASVLVDAPTRVGSSAGLLRTFDGEEMLMRPVLANLCKYESLEDGTLTLDDVDRLNHVLDVQEANSLILERQVLDGRRK